MVSKYSFLVLFLTILVRTIHCVPINNIQFNVNPESPVKNDEDSVETDSRDYDGFHKTESPIPVKNDVSMQEFEKHLNDFLEWYYENYIKPRSYMVYQHKRLNHIRNGEKKPENEGYSSAEEIVDPHDLMQADQPATMKNFPFDEENEKHQEFNEFNPLYVNLSTIVNNITRYPDGDNNLTSYDRYMRDRRDSQVVEDRDKETWLQLLRDNILRRTGRVNGTMPNTGEERDISSLNLTDFVKGIKIPNADEEFVTEKIRSYYPSCEIPKNTDQEVWNDENTMNLYFNVDHGTEENGVIIATATLRLYRLPQENVSAVAALDTSCENTSVAPDEKLLRISIYWYTKSLKKHRVKRRLSDSKVIGENAKWVELSVRPATKAWSKGGKNLGLAVLVEDQEGTVLKADKYFKGASCTQPQNLSQPSLSMQQDGQMNLNELMAMLEEIRQQPCITTYHCSQL
ncbi:hypothetical protein ILUMI_27447 [Ignelater luminosus]|uniref:TGF-beta propeptide domain-containing protein n=1 Tax=Ignelater luminosus TaxID=2038154 RepID=A0A8K0FXS4_IGNLU|nr:hypothetical protein ILUMI_27447 [Ignelater luminosus]